MASNEPESLPIGKRKNDEIESTKSQNAARDEAYTESSSDDDLGPTLPSAAPKKKKRKLQHEKLYMSALPSGARYSKSLMHKEQLSFVTMTPFTDFLITSSVDGIVKFWKKANMGIEFVKEFKAHNGEITAVAVSQDGRSFASAGADATVKIFDVVTFDLLSMLQLKSTPRSICWVHNRGASMPLLAVSEGDTSVVNIYDGRGENQTPTETIEGLHKSPIILMAYNNLYDCVVSIDESGMIEYWSPAGTHEKPTNLFQYKSSTNLFEFRKSKSVPVCITISSSGTHFATLSFPDRRIRVFDFATGKLYRTYDESLQTLNEMQQAGTALRKLDPVDFGRRLAVERDLEQQQQQQQQQGAVRAKLNVLFDESGHFLLYGSLHGTKVINVLTNRVVRVFGADEALRAAYLTLYQGAPARGGGGVVTAQMAASANPLLLEAEERDPLLICTAAGKARFYIFSNDDTVSKAERDVQNEKPRQLGGARREAEAKPADTGVAAAAVIHTTYGDIHVRLFPEAAPKAVENFVTHARSGYYNNTIFHRVIRKFMIQCGDPLGDGTGGESIWGREFEDEFSTLRHDKPYTVSMANAGPNTNGSQFFITTEKCPWLDKKHTIFGRAIQGLDVVHRIENARVYKEKPEEDIKIVSISVS